MIFGSCRVADEPWRPGFDLLMDGGTGPLAPLTSEADIYTLKVLTDAFLGRERNPCACLSTPTRIHEDRQWKGEED